MKLQPDDFKKELQRYCKQLDFLEKNKNEWVGESYSLTKTFYNYKIEEYRSEISKSHPEWLLQFDTNSAKKIQIVKGIELILNT